MIANETTMISRSTVSHSGIRNRRMAWSSTGTLCRKEVWANVNQRRIAIDWLAGQDRLLTERTRGTEFANAHHLAPDKGSKMIEDYEATRSRRDDLRATWNRVNSMPIEAKDPVLRNAITKPHIARNRLGDPRGIVAPRGSLQTPPGRVSQTPPPPRQDRSGLLV